MDLSALVYLVKMVVDCWNSHPKQLCHPLLGKPEGIRVKDDLYLHFASSSLVHKHG